MLSSRSKMITCLLASALAVTGSPVIASSAFAAESSQVDLHLDAATKDALGAQELVDTYRKYSCFEVEDPAVRDEYRAGKGVRVPLTQIFDDLWYIGDEYVGQYILKTASGGFALLDTLNNSSEVMTYTLPALKSLGIGPQHPLEGAFLSHGHEDHDGGAAQLRAVFGPDLPIYLGSADAAGKTYAPEPIDSANPQPQTVTVGGSRIVAQSVPGHTPGSLVALIPVHQNGVRQLMLMNGRAGIPDTVEGSRQYLEGTERAYRLAQEYGATGTIHTHPLSDGSTGHMNAIRDAGTREPNPFVMGNEKTLRAAAIWRECAAARAAQVDSAATIPVWRTTATEILDMRPFTTRLSARVSSGWGTSAGQAVTFDVDGAPGGCTAVTDESGIARCESTFPLLPKQALNAVFDGNHTVEYVNLPSVGSDRVPTPRGDAG